MVVFGGRRLQAHAVAFWLVSGFHAHLEAQDGQEIGVLPPHAEVAGKSLGEWAGLWWQWALSFPVSYSPVFDKIGEHCHRGQGSQVWFLAGLSLSDPAKTVVRECEVPPGKHIFLPVFNSFVSGDPGEVRSCEDVCSDPRLHPGNVFLRARINGVDVPDLESHFESTEPECFVLVLPEGNEFSAPAGCYQPACATGFYLMLEPLGAGATATIEFEASPEGPSAGTVTYLLTASGPDQPIFRRGDVDGNGRLEITDAVFTLTHLFLGGPAPACEDAADADDTGLLDLADAVNVLNHLFLGGCQPIWPGPIDCASDPSDDDLGECATAASC